MKTMMSGILTLGFIVTINTNRTDMITQNSNTIGLLGQIAILIRVMIDAIIAMTTILHHEDSGQGQARVTTIHTVTIEILITNVVTEARTEAKMIMVIRNTITTNEIISQTLGIGRITI